MTLRIKLAGALAKCDGCCLDNEDDLRVVLDVLQSEISGTSTTDFTVACAALRWFVRANPREDRLLKERITLLLKALGEL